MFRTVRLLRKNSVLTTFRRTRPAFPASMTVEAAFALPLFVFMICILMTPMRILDEELMLQEEAEMLTELKSSAGYLKETFSEEPSDWDGMVETSFTRKIRLPFSGFLPVEAGTYTVMSRRRAWIGRDGGAGKAWEEEMPGEIPEEEMVYVAKNSSKSGRYHLSASCHYISNKVVTVEAASVGNLRNASGGRYHPCPSCRPAQEGAVYIFASGDSYHSTPECPSLRSYVEMMPRKEAEERGLSPCSYCSGKH